MCDCGLQGLAKTMRSGETPMSRIEPISDLLAQSNPVPNLARHFNNTGSVLHFTANKEQTG